METVTIVARRREKLGSRASRALRREDMIPAVLYGHGADPLPLALSRKDMMVCLRHNVRVVTIDLEGETDQAVLKDLQWDPFGEYLVHADFLRVRMDEEVTITVPLVASGQPRGLEEGGTLETYRTEVRIRCLPARIPEGIHYDVSGLELNQVLHVSELALPEGVSLEEDPDAVVAAVVSKTGAEEPAAEGEAGEEEGGAGEAGGEQGEEKKDDGGS